jgi:hypothetical protein
MGEGDPEQSAGSPNHIASLLNIMKEIRGLDKSLYITLSLL